MTRRVWTRQAWTICAVSGAMLLAACGVSRKEPMTFGEQQFRARCQSCHSLPKPGSKTAVEWPALVARYGVRANLNQQQVDSITVFLQSRSRQS